MAKGIKTRMRWLEENKEEWERLRTKSEFRLIFDNLNWKDTADIVRIPCFEREAVLGIARNFGFPIFMLRNYAFDFDIIPGYGILGLELGGREENGPELSKDCRDTSLIIYCVLTPDGVMQVLKTTKCPNEGILDRMIEGEFSLIDILAKNMGDCDCDECKEKRKKEKEEEEDEEDRWR